MSANTLGFSRSIAEQLPLSSQVTLCSRSPLALIVDDNDDSLLLMQYALEMVGVAFVATSCGHEAIQLADQYLFSLIFLDIVMFGKNGISVLKELRQKHRYCQTPIIAVTALAFPRDRIHWLATGFSDCLTKPYMLYDLDALIGKHSSS